MSAQTAAESFLDEAGLTGVNQEAMAQAERAAAVLPNLRAFLVLWNGSVAAERRRVDSVGAS